MTTTVVAISMVRNEADIIRRNVLHTLYHVDHLIVADNGSTDGTRQILDDLATRYPIDVVDDPEVGYYQSRKMTALADRAAADYKNTDLWIMPVDGDEFWNVWDDPSIPIKEFIASPLCGDFVGDVIEAALFDYRPSGLDPAGTDPVETIQWCTTKPAALPKIMARYRPGMIIHQGNHGVTLPNELGERQTLLRVNHFPYRSADQFVSKAVQGAAAYAQTDLPDDMGAHWRGYGRIHDTYGPNALKGVFGQYFWNMSPGDAGLVHQPATIHWG
jgi:glycosyltransferase involved in cell wall biosynthesis